jgi:hypothetical protein
MSILPDFFVDPALRTRQDQLNAQWLSLNGIQQSCQGISDSAWVEFVNDLKGWKDFYASESDWDMDSKHATDDWQTKASYWADQFKLYGCGGVLGSVNGVDIPATAGDGGIPSVKANPADDKPWYSGITDVASTIQDDVSTIGWIAVGVVVLVVLVVGYVLTRGKAKGFGVEVGG